MILMYHKVAQDSPTMWWVSAHSFALQMEALSDRHVVHLDDYDPRRSDQVVLTFDDAYFCVYQYAFPILKAHGFPFEVFAIGDFAGHPNTFDQGEPYALCCNIEQLLDMAVHGGRIQWHSRSHLHLCSLSPSAQEYELDVPESWRNTFPPPHFKWLAYPFGEHDPLAADLARRRFTGALSVHQGDDLDPYRRNRVIVEDATDIRALR